MSFIKDFEHLTNDLNVMLQGQPPEYDFFGSLDDLTVERFGTLWRNWCELRQRSKEDYSQLPGKGL